MKVHKPAEIPAQPVNAPLFTGGPVTRQTLLAPEASEYFNLGIVNFSPGARNKMHTHSRDQVLFVTAGKGIIARPPAGRRPAVPALASRAPMRARPTARPFQRPHPRIWVAGMSDPAVRCAGRLGHPFFALGTLAVHAAVGPPAAHRRSPPLTGDQPLVFDT